MKWIHVVIIAYVQLKTVSEFVCSACIKTILVLSGIKILKSKILPKNTDVIRNHIVVTESPGKNIFQTGISANISGSIKQFVFFTNIIVRNEPGICIQFRR